MLEFYPMPTNLTHGSGLYHQNHGGARFLDNPNSVATNSQGTTTTSPTQASCAPSCNNTSTSNINNSSSSPISVTTSSTTSLTAQIISTRTKTITTIQQASTTLNTKTTASNSSSSPNSMTAHSSTISISNSLTAPIISHQILNSIPSISPAAVLLLPSTLASSSSSTSESNRVLPSGAGSVTTPSLTLPQSLSSSKLPTDCNGRTDVGRQIKSEKNYEICEGCGQKIHDRYLMNVGDSNWHEQCLACCYCGMQLHHTCYLRNAKIYCKLDYDRLFGIKCAACCHSILPQEMVMRPIQNFVFHLSCFICFACHLPLQKGEQFMLRDGQLFCYRHDFEKEMYLAAAAAVQHCGYVGVGLDEDELMRPRDGRRGPKRPRTILTSQQRKQFKASFDQSPKPCRKVREALAKDTGLSVRVVQVWFQNQRAKMKKIQRKAKNGLSTNSGSGGSNTGNNRIMDEKDKDRDEKIVKQESGSGSENGYLGLDNSFASQPLNPNLPFSPDDYRAHSNDSFCSSDLSLDGSNFDQLDDDTDSLSLNNLDLQSTGSSGHHHSNPHDIIANLNTSLINPIDKLYLMQNSYFSSEQ